MRIYVHIGAQQTGAGRLQSVLADKRDQLLGKNILFARSPGNKNHTRLFMSVTDPENIDPLRFNRGYITAEKQKVLRDTVAGELAREVAEHNPETLILSCSQLIGLQTDAELRRLRAMLTPIGDDIRIVAHVDEPAALLARIYAEQVLEGRGVSLDLELGLAQQSDWWLAALDATPDADPAAGVFAETQAAAHWLDYPALVEFWEDTFGKDNIILRPFDDVNFCTENVTDEVRAAFNIKPSIGKAEAAAPQTPASAAALARGRQLNALILQVLAGGKRILPRQLWRSFVQDVAVDGPPIDPASLAAVSEMLEPGNLALLKSQKALTKDLFKRPEPADAWVETDPLFGFRPSQYLLGYMWRINKATREERKSKSADLARVASMGNDAGEHTEPPAIPEGLSAHAAKLLPPLAVQNFEKLRTSTMAPHNRLGAVDEEQLAAAYSEIIPRGLPKGNSGNVIVGCMKNEAPYIVEWVAYHRAIGFDNFIIYTNGCADGTSELLTRLQEMGVLQHRSNEDWKGNSPQQYALNQSLKEPLIKNAEWIAHIDVDEYINIRCGNGTVGDFLAAVPDATNVAMTWRLFGHNGITKLADEFVVDQFDRCAPKFCPKPHTVWGFKTMFKNIGAYEKISCHRPNKLDAKFKDRVKWVNGSGADMTDAAAEKGWRNSKKNIGYDLIQLNHYALRSAESFLIKRQRGRALHVDRSIGINYWVRMDWSDFRDITIKRNLPRHRAEFDRLMADKTLKKWHDTGLEWHRAKAVELHGMPEFQELYEKALNVKLTETERVAYALALDTES